MIFALLDLCRYRFRLAHYGDDPGKNILALGHTHRVAEETLHVLAEGDIIICQRMDSLLSWAIMYFGGGYAVDHVAVYIGDGRVLHATLSGVKMHSVHALARGARVLPYRLHGLDEEDPGFKDRSRRPGRQGGGAPGPELPPGATSMSSDHDVLPPHLQLLLAGLSIVLGLRPTSFRWRYYVDVGFVAVLVDLLLWPINQFPMAVTLWTAWLLAIVRMRIRFHRQVKAGHKFEPDSHPGLVMRLMWNQGGHIFPGRPVHGRWKIRVWPLWAVPSSRPQKVPQSQSQQSDQES